MTLLYRFNRAIDSLSGEGPIIYHGMTDNRCLTGEFIPVPLWKHHVWDIPDSLKERLYEVYSGTQHRCVWFASANDYAIAAWLLITMPLLWWSLYKVVIGLWNFASSPLGNGFVSLWMQICKRWSSPVTDSAIFRNRFAKMSDVMCRAPKSHSHPIAAKIRNGSVHFMDNVCALLGRVAYYPQMSRTDERKGKRGARYYHWVKDLNIGFHRYDPDPTEILCFTDVDMYLNMPDILAQRPQMCLVSTFQPTAVASGGINNYAFTFDENDNVVFTVSGGAEFRHPVWNYGTDVLLAYRSSWFGLVHTVVAYHVERRFLDQHHQVLFLVPSVAITSPILNPTRWISGHLLSRLSVVQGGSLVLNIMSKEGMKRSVGQVGKYVVADVSAVEDDTISVQNTIAKVDITTASVRSAIDGLNVQAASVLTAHHRGKNPSRPDTVFPISQSIHHYQFVPEQYDPDAKATLVPFMAPLMLGAYAPTNAKSNDNEAVNERIIKIRPDLDRLDPEVDAFRLQTMKEFVEFIVPDELVHTLCPDDVEDVVLKQDRPAQQAILRKAELAGGRDPTDVVNTFIKKEAYGGIKPPRIITTIPGRTKLDYSRYVVPFSRAIMRRQKWYAFGKKPVEIAERVAEIARSSRSIVTSDASRMDGRVTQPSRDVEYQMMLRAYRMEYHPDLLDNMDKQSQRRAVTPHGIWYETGTARLSGSSETADFNSVDNAEMNYHALRRTGLGPKEAWARLGIYGGDDGLSGDMDPDALAKSFEQVGQLAEIEVFQRGEAGVNFLSRFFGPDVWHGDDNSICDIPRQLSKLHTTVGLSKDVLPLDKLTAKAINYCLTDANTPIIGPICQSVLSLSELKEADMSLLRDAMVKSKPELLRALSWWSRFDRSVQFPNEVGDWALDMARKWLPTYDNERLQRWLSGLNPANVLSPPLIVEPEPPTSKVRVVVNGEVVEPPRPDVPPVDKAKPVVLAVCRDFNSGKGCARAKCKFAHVKKD